MISEASPGRMLVPGLRQAYSPVISAYRDGVQVAAAAWPSVNRSPPAASRSRFGVLTRVAP